MAVRERIGTVSPPIDHPETLTANLRRSTWAGSAPSLLPGPRLLGALVTHIRTPATLATVGRSRRRRPNLVDGEWRWSFARHQPIPDALEPDRTYLDRWRFDTPVGSVFLHAIRLPDRDPDPHTHPFSWSRSLILKGGYTEERGPLGERIRDFRPGRINRIDHDTVHRIVRTRGNRPVWTLFVAGRPHGRGWGFIVDGHYVDHKKYLADRVARSEPTGA